VTVNNFLASGGDGYTVLAQGADARDAGLDLDALEAWLSTNPSVPAGKRITGN
jgi:5'-nucleotidase